MFLVWFCFFFEIRNVYFYRTSLLICCLSFVHKSLFIVDIIEILSICSNKVENNVIVLFILDTSYWGKAGWGDRWSLLWDSEENFRELLQVMVLYYFLFHYKIYGFPYLCITNYKRHFQFILGAKSFSVLLLGYGPMSCS